MSHIQVFLDPLSSLPERWRPRIIGVKGYAHGVRRARDLPLPPMSGRSIIFGENWKRTMFCYDKARYNTVGKRHEVWGVVSV